jgi:hypothetical protein
MSYITTETIPPPMTGMLGVLLGAVNNPFCAEAFKGVAV